MPRAGRATCASRSISRRSSSAAATCPALIRALAATGLPAERLNIEITESALLQDTQQDARRLRQLRDLGVRVSLDDFGTGYSSLSYLHSFPLHKVKIDQSFLQDLTNTRS